MAGSFISQSRCPLNPRQDKRWWDGQRTCTQETRIYIPGTRSDSQSKQIIVTERTLHSLIKQHQDRHDVTQATCLSVRFTYKSSSSLVYLCIKLSCHHHLYCLKQIPESTSSYKRKGKKPYSSMCSHKTTVKKCVLFPSAARMCHTKGWWKEKDRKEESHCMNCHLKGRGKGEERKEMKNSKDWKERKRWRETGGETEATQASEKDDRFLLLRSADREHTIEVSHRRIDACVMCRTVRYRNYVKRDF